MKEFVLDDNMSGLRFVSINPEAKAENTKKYLNHEFVSLSQAENGGFDLKKFLAA